jgi:hypothetical protein
VDACAVGTAVGTSSKRRGLLRKVERKSKTKAQKGKYDYRKWVAGQSSPRAPLSTTLCPPASPSSPRTPSTASHTIARNVAPGSRRASRLMMAALSGAACITGAPSIGPNGIAAWRKPSERSAALPSSPSTYRPSMLSSPTRILVTEPDFHSMNGRFVAEPASPLPSVSHSSPAATEKTSSIFRTESAANNIATSLASPDRSESPAASSPSERGDYALAFLRRRKMAKQKEREAPSVAPTRFTSTDDEPVSDLANDVAEARRSEMRLRETMLDSYPRLPQLDSEEAEEVDELSESSSQSDEDDDQMLGVEVNMFCSNSSTPETCHPPNHQLVVPEESRDVLAPVLQVDLSARMLDTTIDMSLALPTRPREDAVSSRCTQSAVASHQASGAVSRPMSPSLCMLKAPPFIAVSEDANRSSLSGIHDSPHRQVTSVLQLLTSPDKQLEASSTVGIAVSALSPARFQSFGVGDRVAVSFGKAIYHGLVTEIRELHQEAFIKYDDFPVSRGEWKSWGVLTHLTGSGRQLRNRELPTSASPQSARKRSRDVTSTEVIREVPRRISLTSVFEAEPLI